VVSDAGLEAHAEGAAVAVGHVSIRQHTLAHVSKRMQRVLSLPLDNVTCSLA
jgi:hypothetical protein